MTTYVVIPDADINPDKPIKSETAYALRNNLVAVVEGDPTAPSVNPAVLLIGGKGVDGVLNNAAVVTGNGFFEFSSMTVSAAKTLPVASIIRIAGDSTLSSVLTVANQSRTVPNNAQERIEILDFLGGFAGYDGAVSASTGGGGGSVGAGGASAAPVALGGAAKTGVAMSRPWAQRRPIIGGNGGLTSGGGGGNEWGPGGGCIILIVEGNLDATGGEINADGGHANDAGAGTNQPGGGGGGSVIVICTGIITGGTFRARGGNANSGGFGFGGGGGGGWVCLVAPTYAGTQVGTVTGGTSQGAGVGSAGQYDKITLARDHIRTLLQRL